MTQDQQNKGFVIFDFVLSATILTIIFYVLISTFYLLERSYVIEDQKKLDQLIVFSEYILSEYAYEIGGVKQQNWVRDTISKTRKIGGLKLHAGFSQTGDFCIYRLVVSGENKKIKKLYICGEYAND